MTFINKLNTAGLRHEKDNTPFTAVRAFSLVAYIAVALTIGVAFNVATTTDAEAARCGGLNQNACTVLQRPGKPCDAGLKLTRIINGKCVKPRPAGGTAKPYDRVLKVTATHRKVMAKIMRCMNAPSRAYSFRKLIKARAAAPASRIVVQCISKRDRAALRAPVRGLGSTTEGKRFNTILIGLGTGVQMIRGAAVSAGIVIDLNGKVNARFYTISETSKFGLANIGADLSVGISFDKLQPRKKISRDTSYVFAGKVVFGLGISIDLSGRTSAPAVLMPLSKFNGFTISGGFGVGVDPWSNHKQLTTIW